MSDRELREITVIFRKKEVIKDWLKEHWKKVNPKRIFNDPREYNWFYSKFIGDIENRGENKGGYLKLPNQKPIWFTYEEIMEIINEIEKEFWRNLNWTSVR